jgi:soluble lytic murein transglycosylase-like protein
MSEPNANSSPTRRTGDIEGGGTPVVERRRSRGPRRTWTSREALINTLRRPVIGLTLAGAAAPILAVTQRTPDPDDVLSLGSIATPGDPDSFAAAGENLEEALAERLGETSADAERDAEIEAAVERYKIDPQLAADIHDIAAEHNIEPQLAYGLVKVESMFKERAVSHVGARGLTQVMPRTAAWLVPGTSANDLFDRQTNLRLGFQYLDQMIDKYKGNVRLALLAYNRGPGTVDKVLRQGGDPDNGYADKVLRG